MLLKCTHKFKRCNNCITENYELGRRDRKRKGDYYDKVQDKDGDNDKNDHANFQDQNLSSILQEDERERKGHNEQIDEQTYEQC